MWLWMRRGGLWLMGRMFREGGGGWVDWRIDGLTDWRSGGNRFAGRAVLTFRD
jgi:hypothetical protein